MKKKFLLGFIMGLLVISGSMADGAKDLSLGKGDVHIVANVDGGVDLYVAKKGSINSVILVESLKEPGVTNYAYRATEYNSINGDEIRILDGKVLKSKYSQYSLISSTVINHEKYGPCFHIYIPETIVYGYPWARNGSVKIHDGMFFNIRTFEKKYADYRGAWVDNSFSMKYKKPVAKKPSKPVVPITVEAELPDDEDVPVIADQNAKSSGVSVVAAPAEAVVDTPVVIDEPVVEDVVSEPVISNEKAVASEVLESVPVVDAVEPIASLESEEETSEAVEKAVEIAAEAALVDSVVKAIEEPAVVESVAEVVPAVEDVVKAADSVDDLVSVAEETVEVAEKAAEVSEEVQETVSEVSEAVEAVSETPSGDDIESTLAALEAESAVAVAAPAVEESSEAEEAAEEAGEVEEASNETAAEEEGSEEGAEEESAAPVAPRKRASYSINGLNMLYVKGADGLNDFYVSTTEVPQIFYQALMGNNPSKFSNPTNPVESISYYQAIVFCNELSKRTGLTPCYSLGGTVECSEWGEIPAKTDKRWENITCDLTANGYRLLTVAEWEFAARGGMKKDKYEYAGSKKLSEVGWFKSNSNADVHQCAQLKPNSIGIFDMSGNVSEFVMGKGSGKKSACLRGGNYNYPEKTCTISNKDTIEPFVVSAQNGLRIGRSFTE